MSLKTVKNKPNRSAFDLSQRRCFTAKVGELLPVMCKEVLPGDKFNLNLSSFTRTMPVNSAAYTRVKEYYDYFFVPYRLLWRYFDQFITQTSESNPQFAVSITQNIDAPAKRSPYFSAKDVCDLLKSMNSKKNEFGFNRGILGFKLLKYLGYGLFGCVRDSNGNPTSYNYNDRQIPEGSTSVYLNAFPVLAYQKICQDYFRNTQWEKANPSLYNVDYLNGIDTKLPLSKLVNSSSRNLFDINYCTWNKDLFTGILPSPQFGDTAVIGNGALPSTISLSSTDVTGGFRAYQLVGQDFRQDSTSATFSSVEGEGVDFNINGDFKTTKQDLSGFSVLALRQAEALQKWREISISGKQDYKDQIEKHFGISVPEVRSNLCSWIGGSTSVLDIGEVVNTNLQGIGDKNSKVQADIAGRGIGTVNGSEQFTALEHGVLMCIYHSVPLMDYSDEVTDLFTLKGSVYDYAIPEFDSVGMQSLPGISLNPLFSEIGTPVDTDGSTRLTTDYYNSLGYVPRYVDYKTSVDVVLGGFNDTLKFWAAPMSSNYFKALVTSTGMRSLSSSFFKCNPSLLDTIFLVAADGDYRSDNLLVNCYQDIKAVRNLDYNGLPY